MSGTGIILAWDKSEYEEAADTALLESLVPYIDGVKVGLEAMNADADFRNFSVADMIAGIAAEKGLKVMWDAKLHDIGNTVAAAARNILRVRPSISMFTVHAAMSDGAQRAVADICDERSVIALAVTVLTDIDEMSCQYRFGGTVEIVVRHLARIASCNGLGGLVCSPRELRSLQEYKGALADITTVIPGIRPEWAVTGYQKRVATPALAARDGATYIVVGRPIMNPPKAIGSPADAARRIREELDEALQSA